MERRVENRQLVNILALFLIVQFGGMLLILAISPSQIFENIGMAQANTQPFNILYYVLYIIVVTFVILLIMKLYPHDIVFRLIEAMTVVAASFIFFSVVLSILLPQPAYVNIISIISLLLALGLILAKNKYQRLRNIVTLVASIGFGIAFWQIIDLFFGFEGAYIFVALIALYDYIAVFITKHMLTLAKFAVDKNLALLIGSSDVEIMPSSSLSKQQISEYMKGVNVKDIKNPTLKRMVENGDVPVMSQAALGAGDLGIPLMFAISVYTTFVSIFASMLIIIGAAIGLLATLFILRKYKFGLPAIPPLFAFMNVALGIGLFIKGDITAITALMLMLVAVLIMAALLLTVRLKKNS